MNNKGGTGKTTTCINLAAVFAKREYRVLLIDLAPQGSASLALCNTCDDLSPSVLDVLLAGMPIKDAKKGTGIPGLDLLTGEIELANTNLIMADIARRESRLKRVLEVAKGDYDSVFCDCPPALSLLSINALIASGSYIVPVTPGIFGFRRISCTDEGPGEDEGWDGH